MRERYTHGERGKRVRERRKKLNYRKLGVKIVNNLIRHLLNTYKQSLLYINYISELEEKFVHKSGRGHFANPEGAKLTSN